ncbi:MAG: hypothetical protein SGI90_05830 [Candidatus Eisenbacteria bacterium]|nr:hypothetical protein [Candidatus Eisenbacteria bacterium]
MPTCTTSGCHPKAWTETIFHRVDPEIFKDCTNCHVPHAWKAVGADCRSCHGNAATPAATAAMASFVHDRHADLECAVCHQSTERHGSLVITANRQCQACHHGPPPAAACGACHGATEISGQRIETVLMRLSAGTPPRERPMEFDHARHTGVACETCHITPIEGGVRADCAGCHQKHDRPEASCRTCHAAPPAGVHSLKVHDTGCAGSGCHTDNGIESTRYTRELCLSCHTELFDHQPGKACASCHLVALGHTGGGS